MSVLCSTMMLNVSIYVYYVDPNPLNFVGVYLLELEYECTDPSSAYSTSNAVFAFMLLSYHYYYCKALGNCHRERPSGTGAAGDCHFLHFGFSQPAGHFCSSHQSGVVLSSLISPTSLISLFLSFFFGMIPIILRKTKGR